MARYGAADEADLPKLKSSLVEAIEAMRRSLSEFDPAAEGPRSASRTKRISDVEAVIRNIDTEIQNRPVDGK